MNADTSQATIFETRLREDIEKRKGKAPVVPKAKVEKFIKDCIRLRFEPDWKMAGVILGRIMEAQLYLLSDDDPEQFLARLASRPEDQLAEQSTDADAGAQADAAGLVEASDSPEVEHTNLGGQDVRTGDAGERGTAENKEPTSSTDATPCPEKLVPDFSLDLLDENAGTESRELHPQTVDDYAEHWKSGGTFSPILVYQDGDRHFLADGFHRKAGARKAGRTHVPALVRVGNRLEALEASLGSNHTNGERRSVEDKCYAVDKALKEFPDHADRRLADMCGVSPTFVSKRRELMPEPSTVHVDSSAKPTQKTRVGRDGRHRKVPGPKGGAQGKSTQKPQAKGQTPAETWNQHLCRLKQQVKALTSEVRKLHKLYPDQSKPLKDVLEPFLGKLARLLT
jgi:hypothetical protein